jgi:hypothetical protein
LLLVGCSEDPAGPTPEEASAALTHEARMAWVANGAPDRGAIRVDQSGRHITMVQPGGLSTTPRLKPPSVIVNLVSVCSGGPSPIVCDTDFAIDGRKEHRRVQYWRSGSEWRAHSLAQ